MPRPPKLIARDARILAAYSAGATIPQIAVAEQIDTAIVVRAAHAYHPAPARRPLPARRRREEYARLVRGWRTWPADVQERAVALYCAGQSAPVVAAELGVSENGVYELLRERGVVRSKSEAQRLVGRRWREEV